MENSSRLLERHHDSLATRHVLLVGADDRNQWQLPAASLTVHSDDAALAGEAAAMLPSVPAGTDLIIVVLPKSRQQLAFWLAALRGQLQRDTEVWLLGPASGGIRGGVSELKALGVDVQQLDSARHYKLFASCLSAADFDLDSWRQHWCVDGLNLISYPGVFSHGRADPGTDLLLDALQSQPLQGSALDLGCGAGVISAWLARRGLTVTATDVSAAAVAATSATLASNKVSARVLCGDLYQRVSGRFDLLITNPPFHDGTRRTTEISRRLITSAPDYLKPGGQLWLVANQGLPYGDWLHASFASVRVAKENRQFRVWHCH